MKRVLERAALALETGEWWAIPWWRDDQYYKDGLFTKDEVEDAFTMLRQTFDEKWFISQRDSQSIHPLFDMLLVEGLLPFSYLVKLGRDLLDANRAKANLIGNIPRRLKDANEYLGAHFELEMIAHLLRRGYVVKRNPLSGTGNKRGDLQVNKSSEELFIELKRLEWSKVNKDISDISQLISNTILSDPVIRSTPNFLCLELSEDLRTKAKTKNGLNDLRGSWQKITQQIRGDIVKRIINEEWGHHIIPELAEYDLYPRQGEDVGGTGGFGGLLFSQWAEAQKIFQNALEAAKEQLPKDRPGVLIVHNNTPFPIDSSMLQLGFSSFGTDWQKYRHLSAIIVIHISFSARRIYYHMEFIQNTNALYDVSDYAVVRDILSLGDH